VKSKYNFETTPQRSLLMSKIKATNTKAEVKLRKALWALGIRYRINVSKYPGKPDIVISKTKIAIFIDGEFWHGFNWQIKKDSIKSNKEYWVKKIEGNMHRDLESTQKLKEMGFTVFRFWEQEIKKDIDACLQAIVKAHKDSISD